MTTKSSSSTLKRGSATEIATEQLFVLNLSGGQVFSINPDGSGAKTLVTGCRNPDGIAVDAEAGHIYWTNMGVPSRNDGSIERADIDGGNRRLIVPEGSTFTPKQLTFDRRNRKLHWCDREGMRVMRANLDGSNIEILVQTGNGDNDRRDQTRWCVGITVRHRLGALLLVAEGAGQSRPGPDLSRGHRHAAGRDCHDAARHHAALRRSAGADRSRDRRRASHALLD
jgi:sugar lactone lactonase YvrE